MKKQKLNIKLLRRIQKHILKEPRRFFMQGYQIRVRNQKNWEHQVLYYQDASEEMPPCGTAACIAGWANILSGHPRARSLEGTAKRLGLNNETYDYDRLFWAGDWPHPFAVNYILAQTPAQRAKIACKRIDYLIRTGR